jgi:hypothetical protein
MDANYKITIPKPCHEDWNQMTPDQTGRFCNSCVKSVVDFTGMKTPEIQEYFIKNQGQNVCGRFKTEQLDSIIIQIPRDVLFAQVQFHKIFMLALLVSMGTTLFSCQNNNGDKQNIDKVEVVDSIRETRTMGAPMRKTNDTVAANEHGKKIRTDSVQFVTSGLTAQVPIITGDVIVEPDKKTVERKQKGIYFANEVEILPTFPGGISTFYDYINSNLKLSDEDKKITRRIIVSFIVDTDGSLLEVKTLRSINLSVDNEVIRVINSSKWIPGEQNGQKVKVAYSLPIKITAQ